MKFVVVDYDKNLGNEDQEIIGELRCTLTDIVGSANSTYTNGLVNPLKFNRKNGYLSVHGEEFEERMLCIWCFPTYKKIEQNPEELK
jgi:hypothetical protein